MLRWQGLARVRHRGGHTFSRVLTLQLKKHADGRTAFSLLRADGSRTWQRQERHASFFAAHDLTHYAVETVLGLRGAFYGLVAQGWDFDDFLPPYPRGPLPAEALYAETLVGLLDVERGTVAHGATLMSAEEFAAQLASKLESAKLQFTLPLDESRLQAVRSTRDALIARWQALPSGQTLELAFPA